MPLKTLLDPQGKAVNKIIKNQGFAVENVRIGKHITFEIEAENEEEAESIVMDISEKILINPVIEEFSYNIEKV